MESTIVRSTETRRSETSGGVMTTLVSPTLSGPTATSLWRVELKAGQSGPVHYIDSPQIWTVLSGRASIRVQGTAHELATGDTIAIDGASERQVVATDDTIFLVCGQSDAKASLAADTPGVTPPWIA
ncbi:MAG: cupin domain-containing protein [Thermomicrobiales bacterium]